jgi:DNA-binding Xre family transcriptional regulator
VITICSNHKCLLSVTCPHCEHQLPHLAPKLRPGYCSQCKQWLGTPVETLTSSNELVSEDKIIWQNWVMDLIGAISVEFQQSTNSIFRQRISDMLRHCINERSNGSINKFSQFLGFDDHAIRKWIEKKRLPKLQTLVEICSCLEVSVNDFLYRDYSIDSSKEKNSNLIDPSLFITEPDGSKKMAWHYIEEYLRNAENKFPPVPLPRLAREIGYARDTLKKYFPELCQMILKRYSDYHSNPFDKKIALKELNRALVENPPPSLLQVYRRLEFRGTGGGMLEKNFPEICIKIKQRYADYKRGFNIEEVALEIQKAIIELPPPSLRTLSIRLCCARSTLICRFPELCAEISRRYLAFEEDRKSGNKKLLEEEVRNNGIALYQKGIYPSIKRIRESLSVPVSSLVLEELVRNIQSELGVR